MIIVDLVCLLFLFFSTLSVKSLDLRSVQKDVIVMSLFPSKSLPPMLSQACRAGAIHWIHHCLETERTVAMISRKMLNPWDCTDTNYILWAQTTITITGRDSSPRYWMYFGRITFVIQGYPTPLREDQSFSENPRRSRFAGHSFWPSSIPEVKWHNFTFSDPSLMELFKHLSSVMSMF